MAAVTHVPLVGPPPRAIIARLAMVALALGAPVAAAQRSAAVQLDGRVIDSVRGRPLARASVLAMGVSSVTPTFQTAIADDLGRFHFDSLPAGRYALSFTHPALDSLDVVLPDRFIMVQAGERARLDLAVPSSATLRGINCPGVAFGAAEGVLLGTVTNAADDQPVGGATVVVSWSDVSVDHALKRPVTRVRTASAPANRFGEYRFCGVPTDSWLVLQVQQGDASGAPIEVVVDGAAGVLRRDLAFSPLASGAPVRTGAVASADPVAVPTEGSAVVSGVVVDFSDRPLRDVDVRLENARGSARTDSLGRFTLSGQPAGTRMLEARRVGYTMSRSPVQLRDGAAVTRRLRLVRGTTLDAVHIVAERGKYPEFDRHRLGGAGVYMDEAEILRRAPYRTSELLRNMPGFRLVHDGFDDIVATARDHTNVCKANIVIDRSQHHEIYEVFPGDIARMEIYRGTEEAPPEYDAECGLVVIWTRLGDKYGPAPDAAETAPHRHP